MQLKSIEIIGFKSFAEKTTITFPNGMTGIVGPNGSGKSNIAEAIRWVLGEQSAKNLRGSRMPDVIFSGSADRRSLNMAAVTLLLDNSDHYLDSPYSEIKVSRKLFRNGDSSYFINEKQCRLKDIADLFMDTGIGQGSLSIISQGNVEEIFNSKPIDRRSIFENVAGVYKYKRQKSTAQSEILQTSDNLDRVNDIIHELEVRLPPLEEQSSQATDYLDQKKRLDELEKRQLIMSIKQRFQEKQKLADQLKDAEAMVKKLTVQIQKTKQQRNTLKDRLGQDRQTVDTLNSKLMSITTHIESLKSKQQLSSQENSFKNADLQRLTGQLEKTASQLSELEEKLTRAKHSVDQTKAGLAQNRDQLRLIRQQADQNQVPIIEEKIKQLHAAYFDLLQQQSDLKNQISLNQKDSQRFEEQVNAQKARIEQVNEELASYEPQLKTQAEKVSKSQTALKAEQQNLTQLQVQLKNQSQLVDQTQSSWLGALKVAEQARAKADSLKSLHDSYRAFYRGTANLLRHRDALSGIYGPVADYLKVNDRFVKAIETALGSQAQHVIVTDNQSASAAIKFMTSNRYGRVTLLPVSTIKARRLNTALVTAAKQVPGYIGIASELITMPTEFREIKQFLLGTTVIADTLDNAIQISQRIHHRTRVVSLDGQVVNAGGSLTGGANKSANQGVLVQKSELEKLNRATDEMAGRLSQKEHQLKTAKEALEKIRTGYNQSRQTTFRLQQQLDNQTKTLTALRQAQAAKKRHLETLKLSLVNAQKQNQSQNEQDLVAQKARLDQQIKDTSTKIEANQAQLGNVKKNAELFSRKEQSLHDQIVISKEQLQHYQDDQKRLTSQLTQLKAQRQSLKNQLSTLKADLAEQIDPVEIGKAIERDIAEQKTITASLNTKKETVSQADSRYDQLQAELQNRQSNLTTAVFEQKAVKKQYQELTENLTASLERLKNIFNVTKADLERSDWHWDLNELTSQIKILKMGIEEIGPVNISAIQEFQDVSDRYHFLLKQRQDLLDAKNHLTSTMNKMDHTITEKFQTTFNKVAAAFSKVFIEMFGGGEAKLVLTDPDDLLTTGIEIMVKPPGKNYRSLSLLSGGEKALTAITLLFAIIKVSPVPFCILDEAEAALDPYNADRFARYLKKFGNETQFIVITHRKETMVYADTLYGITMQESGVSKVVSVNLDNLKTEVS
ncbi:chromosome segregation protein SMC [Lentilactobacillus farraginis]|uniref:Chromosome partition protein Smc n=2 Tax=Lentilactobacillus farraginis DSM 18382 = JCM 14108 TaxID=1423743 RepID=A0A0R1W2T9_9LACO|nr:chromosome segregation protein SMC [Lentilactobacillus farraginis]KRM09715.1 SMC structural maintenance of chromosomes partitioning protein [Lentilactobacillus farraginis DSM 18382 = JCM 14108]